MASNPIGQSAPRQAPGGVPPLPAPVTTPPALPMAPDTLITGAIHSLEYDASKAIDVLAKVPFLKDLGYKIYGMLSGRPEDSPVVGNLGSLTPGLYRGGQPSEEGFRTLAADGVNTVINLRPEEQWEKPMVERAGMKYVYLPLPPVGPPTNAQALQFLSLVTDPKNGKIFFHCQHGSDRTGAMAAVYRIAVQGWTVDQALAEMPEYHFHAGFEDAKIGFVRQFARYWASLPATQRSQVLHGRLAPDPTSPVAGGGGALSPKDLAAPSPHGATDAGGPVQMTTGNSAQLFVGRQNSFHEALKLINGARQSVQFESFTFNGQMGLAVAQAMINARARGVNVQVVIDPKALLVSDGKGIVDMLRQHGVDVRIYQESHLHDPLVAIDHAKDLVVDGKTALVGDSNFDRYVDYDLDYALRGPIVPKVQAMFAQSWANAKPATGPLVSAGLPAVKPVPVAQGTPVPGGDAQIGLTETAPTTDGKVGDQTYNDTLTAIQHAQKSIDVLMYTLSDPAELAALEAAAKRGVQVRVVVSPSKKDYNMGAVEQLQRAGIPVRWFHLAPGEKEMHSKTAIVDGTVIGGSTNWVHSSDFDNHELGLWLQGPVADQVQQVFDHVWADQTDPVGPITFLDRLLGTADGIVSQVL